MDSGFSPKDSERHSTEMAGDPTPSDSVGNDKNTSTINPAQEYPATSKSGKSGNKDKPCQENMHMQEGDTDEQVVADFRSLPLVLVPSSGNDRMSAVEQEQSSGNINTNRVSENVRDLPLVSIDNARSAMVLPPVLNAPTLIPQQPNVNDPLYTMMNVMIGGFQHLSFQMQGLAASVEQANGNLTEVSQNQNQTNKKLDGITTSVEEMKDELRMHGGKLNNLEGYVNVLSEDLKNFLRRIDDQLPPLPVLEQPAGAFVIRRPNTVFEALLAMPRYQQFLAVLGVIGIGFMSWRLALWAYPYIVEAVPLIYHRVANLATIAAGYLANVNWDAFFRRFANMGREGGFNFEQFMNDPIARMMAGGMFGNTILVFIMTLIEVIRQRCGDNFNA